MALIVVKDIGELKNYESDISYLKCFRTKEEVQMEYCSRFEWEDGDSFLKDSEVAEYLELFGVRYKGNYILECDDWGVGCAREKEQFITYLNPTLQLGCLAMQMVCPILIEERLFNKKHLLPVLKKRDIYLKDEMFEGIMDYVDVVEDGAELKIAGKSLRDMPKEELWNFLLRISEESQHLTRELDAKVFDKNAIGIFEEMKMTLNEYVTKYPYETDNAQREYEDLVSEDFRFADTMVYIKGRNVFNGIFRRYPIHYLFYIDGEWKYISNNSVKWPTFMELLEDAVLRPTPFDYKKERRVDISNITKVFSLVLNCNEVCDVSRYWEHIAFIAKYDVESNVLEICNHDKGLLEFHELLQKSTDF